LERLFGLPFSRGGVNHLKATAATRYRQTYEGVVRRLVAGNLIQADETKAKIDGQDGYVWVFTSLQDVTFVYRATREANFLHEFMEGFEGVLVSDFYSGYDSVQCAQQKCLIHLMRDMNDDLRRHPFGLEMKGLAEAFAELLRTIVATVDRFGLKRRYLQKHKAAAEAFLEMVKKSDFQTEVAVAYRTRFERNRDTLFTFLDHDCRWRRKTGPFWRGKTDQQVGYALAFTGAEKSARTASGLLLWHFLCGCGLPGLLSQPGAVGFACDLQNDRSLD
jgi:hypothetical protein